MRRQRFGGMLTRQLELQLLSKGGYELSVSPPAAVIDEKRQTIEANLPPNDFSGYCFARLAPEALEISCAQNLIC
jgi:hypothetical protein